MGDVIAEGNVYGEDADGKRRLLYIAGQTIPEEDAKRLGIGEKAKKKASDKSVSASATKDVAE